MKFGNILIAAFWLYLLLDGYYQGQALPELVGKLPLPAMSRSLIAVILALLFAFSLAFTFWQRRRLMEDMPLVTRFVDDKFGEGTYRDFCHRLRPVAISVLAGLLIAISGMRATFATTKSPEGYFFSLLFLAVALGLLAAYLLSRRYPPELR